MGTPFGKHKATGENWEDIHKHCENLEKTSGKIGKQTT
jgi:hypothetical protein